MERWIAKHWVALTAGFLLMGALIRITYAQRGYVAVGSEWFALPLTLILEAIFREVYGEERQGR